MSLPSPLTPGLRRALRNGRSAPYWVRKLSDRDLHGIAGRFVRLQKTQDLTPGQEWLLEQCFADLAFRRRRTRPAWRACSCEYCFEPFSDEDVAAAWRPEHPR